MCTSHWDSETDTIIYDQDCGDPACASSLEHSAANDRPR